MSTIQEEPLVPGLGEDAVPGALADLSPEEERARRRKKILLMVLGGLAALFLVIAGWYLLTRKPLAELPILTVDTVPAYRGSVNTDYEPMGVAVSADGGRIYVTSADGSTPAQVLDSSGAVVATMTPPKKSGAAHMPTYPVLSPGGEVYVTDRITSEVYVYDENGEYLRTFVPKGALATTWAPLALAVDSAGSVYANDASGEQTIRKFAADGTELAQFGSPGESSFVNGLLVDDDGALFVADSNNGRVVAYSPEGAMLWQINSGAGTGELGMPRGLARTGDHLYVVDTVNQDVTVYNVADPAAGPKYVGTMGFEGTGDGMFEFPNGAAADSRDRLYIADRLNRRIQIWSR
jgi:DNA-binding beta-propeller fold protein YncE